MYTITQWLKGRISENFCDISPDGKYFIFSFYKKGWGYTAISRAPWIKAILLLKNLGGWGGGFFINSKQYTHADSSGAYVLKHLSDELLDSGLEYLRSETTSHVYYERLIKRGWKEIKKTFDLTIYTKNLDQSTRLEKVLPDSSISQPEGKGRFWEYHRLVNVDHVIDKYDWEWCEYKNNQLYWADKGCLYRTTWRGLHSINEAEKIYDFNPETFKERCAPYTVSIRE